jgi:hypothetical protein
VLAHAFSAPLVLANAVGAPLVLAHALSAPLVLVRAVASPLVHASLLTLSIALVLVLAVTMIIIMVRLPRLFTAAPASLKRPPSLAFSSAIGSAVFSRTDFHAGLFFRDAKFFEFFFRTVAIERD